jgi:hypothetical protein
LRQQSLRITVMPVVSFEALPIRMKGSITEQVSPVPRIKLTKGAIDGLPTGAADVVYWDNGCPGFGIKVTPKGRKVFLVLYRTGGASSNLRKYTIGPYGKVTLHQARIAAQKVFSAKLEGRDPAREKREARIRDVTDRVAEVLETYISQHVSANRSAAEISRLLRREVGGAWGHKSIHDISKRDVVELVLTIDQRGAPAAANKTLSCGQGAQSPVGDDLRGGRSLSAIRLSGRAQSRAGAVGCPRAGAHCRSHGPQSCLSVVPWGFRKTREHRAVGLPSTPAHQKRVAANRKTDVSNREESSLCR